MFLMNKNGSVIINLTILKKVYESILLKILMFAENICQALYLRS